jgi:hypothetical protein
MADDDEWEVNRIMSPRRHDKTHTYFGVEVDEDLHELLCELWPPRGKPPNTVTEMIRRKARPLLASITQNKPHVAFGVCLMAIEQTIKRYPAYKPAVIRALESFRERVIDGRMYEDPSIERLQEMCRVRKGEPAPGYTEDDC